MLIYVDLRIFSTLKLFIQFLASSETSLRRGFLNEKLTLLRASNTPTGYWILSFLLEVTHQSDLSSQEESTNRILLMANSWLDKIHAWPLIQLTGGLLPSVRSFTHTAQTQQVSIPSFSHDLSQKRAQQRCTQEMTTIRAMNDKFHLTIPLYGGEESDQ